MNQISYEIYIFTKKFLKLTEIKLSARDWIMVIPIATILLSLTYLFTSLINNIFDKYFFLVLIVFIISLLLFILHISDINKDNEKKNFLDIHSGRYYEFQVKFAEKYGPTYGKRLEKYLESAKEELESDINRQIEKSKYQLDKVVSLLTLTPLLTVFISYGKNNSSENYNPQFVSFSVGLILIFVILICFWIGHIYSPSFSPLNDVANRQKVLQFLKGYLVSDIYSSNSIKNVNHFEDSVENIDLERNEIMKNKLFYRIEDGDKMILNILFGLYSHEISNNQKHLKIFWGLIESKYPFTR